MFATNANDYIDTPANRARWTREYAAQHVTAAMREVMETVGMSEVEYLARLQQVLFPYPIIYTSSGTNTIPEYLR
jgi:hypothetical protein